MQGQLDEMQAEQRPWVSVVGSPIISDAVTTNVNGLSLPLSFVLRNSGRNPAVNAFVNFDASLGRLPNRAWQNAVCDQPAHALGITLFSNDQATLTEERSIPRAELDNWTKRFAPGPTMATPWLVACVVYKDAISGNWHHTPYAFKLEMNRASLKPERGCCAIFLKELPIKGRDLIVPLWPIALRAPD